MPEYHLKGSLTRQGIYFYVVADNEDEAIAKAQSGDWAEYDTSGSTASDWDIDPSSIELNEWVMPNTPIPALLACRDALADLLPTYLATVAVMLDGEATRRAVVPTVDASRFPVVVAAQAALRSAGV